MFKFYFITLIVFLTITQNSFAKEYTLSESIKIAQEKSEYGNIIKKSKERRELLYKSFMASYLPQINLNVSALNFNRSITEYSDRIYDSTSQKFQLIKYFPEQSNLSNSLDLSISQIIPWTGASISFSSGVSRLDNVLDNSVLFRSTPLNLYIHQPLFQFNSMKWDKEVEELNFKKNEKIYYEAFEDLAVDVTNKYFNLYIAQKEMINAQRNIHINDTLYTLSKGRFELGTIAENDLLQSELGFMNAKNSFESAKLRYERAKENLKIILSLPENEDIKINPPLEAIIFEIDKDFAFQNAMENRPQIIDFEIQKLNAERNLNVAENRNNFQASINAGFGLNQSAGNFDEAYKELLDQETFNLTLTIPIYQWGKGSADVEAALINKQSVEEQLVIDKKKFELDVKYQINEYIQLQKQVELSKKTYEIADKRFDISSKRFNLGKINMTDFFNAQRDKDNALTAYIKILRDYWVGYYNLRKLTLYDFKEDKIIEY